MTVTLIVDHHGSMRIVVAHQDVRAGPATRFCAHTSPDVSSVDAWTNYPSKRRLGKRLSIFRAYRIGAANF